MELSLTSRQCGLLNSHELSCSFHCHLKELLSECEKAAQLQAAHVLEQACSILSLFRAQPHLPDRLSLQLSVM